MDYIHNLRNVLTIISDNSQKEYLKKNHTFQIHLLQNCKNKIGI